MEAEPSWLLTGAQYVLQVKLTNLSSMFLPLREIGLSVSLRNTPFRFPYTKSRTITCWFCFSSKYFRASFLQPPLLRYDTHTVKSLIYVISFPSHCNSTRPRLLIYWMDKKRFERSREIYFRLPVQLSSRTKYQTLVHLTWKPQPPHHIARWPLPCCVSALLVPACIVTKWKRYIMILQII